MTLPARLAVLIDDMMAEFQFSDQDFMELHDRVDWSYTDYDTVGDFINTLKAEIKAPGTTATRTVPQLLSDFMRQHDLDDDGFMGLHAQVPWHDAHDEDFPGLLREIESVMKRSQRRDYQSTDRTQAAHSPYNTGDLNH